MQFPINPLHHSHNNKKQKNKNTPFLSSVSPITTTREKKLQNLVPFQSRSSIRQYMPMAAPTYLNRFSIKKLPITTVPVPLVIHGLIGFFLLYIIFDWGKKLFNFLSQTQKCTKSKVGSSEHTEKNIKTSQNLPLMLVDGSLCREEVEKIMGKLDIFCNPESEKLQERFDSDIFCNLFGDEEEYDDNNMEELREAFNVFDENRDGFIDEVKLQRVLCALGLKQGAELENCRKMILAFDQNGDGKIDFEEFVEMIQTFC